MAHLAAQYVPLEIPKLENLMLRKKKGGGIGIWRNSICSRTRPARSYMYRIAVL